MSQEQIAKVLAEHHVSVVSTNGDGTTLVMCSCGHETGMTGSADLDYGNYATVNAAHQASVLAPLFAEAQAEAWEEGKESFAKSLLSPLGRNGMRTGIPNPYRLAQFQADPDGRALVAGTDD